MTRPPEDTTTGERTATCDCVIVGAGPAGLTAAVYLARFHRRVFVFDGGRSRARWIPESHNCPGFPGGISGEVLLTRLCAQLAAYDAPVARTCVKTVRRSGDNFEVAGSDGSLARARTVLLATGIVDRLPDVDWAEQAIAVGALRLCPVCDGYEATDRRIAVYGPGLSALDHAVFLRTFFKRRCVDLLGRAANGFGRNCESVVCGYPCC